MQESSSVIDLEQRLNERGYHFDSCKDYVKFLRTEWEKENRITIDDTILDPPEAEDLPTVEVNQGYATYYLHGIIHGISALLMPGWHLRPRVQSFIKECLVGYDEPLEGSIYLTEENLSHSLGLPTSRELKDVSGERGATNPFREPVLYFRELALVPVCLAVMMGASIILPVLYGTMYLLDRSRLFPQAKKWRQDPSTINHDDLGSYLQLHALKDERYQIANFEHERLREMPEPFGLETFYMDKVNSKVWTLLKMALGHSPDMPTVSERSLWTARQLQYYALEEDIKHIHYICGSGHIPQIEYFLRNPDYSFEPLNEFIRAKDKR